MLNSNHQTTGENGPRKADTKSSDSKIVASAGTEDEVLEKKCVDKIDETVADSSPLVKKVAEVTTPDGDISGTTGDASVGGHVKEKEEEKLLTQGGDKDCKMAVVSSAQQQRENRERVNRERMERERKDRPRRPPSPHRPRQQVLTFQHIRVFCSFKETVDNGKRKAMTSIRIMKKGGT